MTDSTITIEVDGQTLEAKPGQMLIEVTDAAGISVPRFCYHDKLSIAANCRMCLVDVEKAPKPLPACATPCTDGMKVHTQSPRALAAQKGTMEFLLINHPLDCPICDQGGECELQDVAMGYGGDVSRFSEGKRVVTDPDLGSLVATDMTRCIHCTRCVRFGAEIAGIREMGATGRGEHMKIGTYVKSTVDSELSGNIIDICPVGALTSKPARYQARAWELTQSAGIAAHDSVGSNIFFHVRRNQIIRVVPRTNEAVNECWISDRDRFSYQGIYADDRLAEPMLKSDGKWKTVSWDEALEAAAASLKACGSSIGTLVSPNSTLEEMYLAQKLTRALGSANVDHRLQQSDCRNAEADPILPWLGQSIAQLENNQATLLFGSNIRKDQPLLGLRLRKAVMAGNQVMAINPVDYDFNFEQSQSIISKPSAMLGDLAAVARAAAVCVDGLQAIVDAAVVTATHQQIADNLKNAQSATVLLGNLAQSHPDFSLIRAIADALCTQTGAVLGLISPAANSAGGWASGSVPHRLPGGENASQAGLCAQQMLTQQQAGYLLVNVEPECDLLDINLATEKLSKAKTIALTSFKSALLMETADILLPVGTFAETSGSYLNTQAELQSFGGCITPLGDARPAWKVLRVLGNMTDCEGFDYQSSQDVVDELLQAGEINADNSLRCASHGEAELTDSALERVGDSAIYSSDSLVRRSAALQHTTDAWGDCIRISESTATDNAVNHGDAVAIASAGSDAEAMMSTVVIDNRVPAGAVWLPAAVSGTHNLTRLFGEVTLTKG